MPGKILGIDIDSDSITAVQVEGGLRGYSITGCGRVMIEQDGDLDKGLSALSERVDLSADTSMGSIPVEQISYRNLQMPFRDIKRIRQAITFEVETLVPFSIEDLIVDFTIIDQLDQSEVLAASVKRGHISHILSQLQGHGVDPELLDIRGVPIVLWLLKQDGIPDNGLLLEIGLKKGTMILFLNRRISLIRNFSFGNNAMAHALSKMEAKKRGSAQKPEKIASHFQPFCRNVQNTLHAFGFQVHKEVMPEKVFLTGEGSLYPDAEGALEGFLDMPVERVDVARDAKVQMNEATARVWSSATMDSALALAIRDSKQGLGFNFRKDEFRIERRYFRLKRVFRNAAIFLIIIMSLLIADLGTEYYFLKKRYTMLDRQVTEVFRKTLPEVKRIVDPVQQMKVKISELKTSDLSLLGIGRREKVLDLLRDFSLRVPESLDVRIQSMVVDPENVQIKGETDTFNTVDIIKKGLEPSRYFSTVTISSANLDRSGKRVQFEMKLKRAR
jgi:general secretion pathway protein L